MVFSFIDEEPPPTILTNADNKIKYEEPDWYPAPNANQQGRQQQQHHDSRGDNYNTSRGNNSLAGDERDTRMPGNNFQYPRGAGVAMSPRGHPNGGGYQPQSPRQFHPPSPLHQFQQYAVSYATNENAPYLAAIKAVNDSMSANSSKGSITALRGLWKVFDASVCELGGELNESLSNKAIFEACVLQETSQRQGKTVSEYEKKIDAANRRQHYEANLKNTMLRLRGSFADVLLGVKKDIQASIDKRASEMEKDFNKKIASKTKEIDKQIEMSNREADLEIKRLNNELQKAELIVARIQSEMAEEREHVRRAIEQAEKGREEAVLKLSSTLETLHNACASAQTSEKKCRDAEMLLQQAISTQKDLEEAASLENERGGLLQQKLDEEVKIKRNLMNVQQEMEQHLALERERADLLQQEFDMAISTKQEVLRSMQELENHKNEELAGASRMNLQLREQLKHANEAGALLNEKIGRLQPHLNMVTAEKTQLNTALNSCKDQLDKTIEMNGLLNAKVQRLEAQIDEQSVWKDQLDKTIEMNGLLNAKVQRLEAQIDEQSVWKDQLDKTIEMNSLLASKASRLEAQVEDQTLELQAAKLSEADVEASLSETLQLSEDLTARLNALKNEKQVLAEKLQEESREKRQNADSLREATQLVSEFEDPKNCRRFEVLKDVLESERDSLREKLEKSEEEYTADRDKIAEALLGFNEEMTNAETKIKGVLDELEKEKAKVKALTEENENLSNKVDVQKLQLEVDRLKEELETKNTTHEQELGVFQEAIKILQVKLAEGELAMKSANNESDEAKIKDIKQQWLASLGSQKGKYDVIVERKELEVSQLKKALIKERSRLTKLEVVCVKARKDLLRLRDQKKSLEASLQKSIDFIKDLKYQKSMESVDDYSTRPQSSRKHQKNGILAGGVSIEDYDDVCFPIIDAVIDPRHAKMIANGQQLVQNEIKELGGDLEDLLTCIETQLSCGGDEDRTKPRKATKGSAEQFVTSTNSCTFNGDFVEHNTSWTTTPLRPLIKAQLHTSLFNASLSAQWDIIPDLCDQYTSARLASGELSNLNTNNEQALFTDEYLSKIDQFDEENRRNPLLAAVLHVAVDLAAASKAVSLFGDAPTQEMVDNEERKRLQGTRLLSYDNPLTADDFCPYLQMKEMNNLERGAVTDDERRARRKAITKLCRANPLWILLPMNPRTTTEDEDALEGDPPRGTNALHVAVRSRNATLTNLLIKYCKRATEICDGDGCTPLHYAVRPPDELAVYRKAILSQRRSLQTIGVDGLGPMDAGAGGISSGSTLTYYGKIVFKSIHEMSGLGMYRVRRLRRKMNLMQLNTFASHIAANARKRKGCLVDFWEGAKAAKSTARERGPREVRKLQQRL
eukprot:g3330.t1 g3330   contig12:1855108-1860390(-)